LRAIERAKRLQSMGLMVGGVAHDFNNLLTVILSVSSILETQLPDDPDARELLAELKQSAVRASGLAKQLLSTRPEAEDEPIDVHCELRALTPLFARLCGGRVTVEVFVDHEPCFVRIERAKLEQIAINLVVNARDAMPNGGRLAVKTSLLSADGRGVTRPCVELAVADTGVGMDTTTQQRMFEPFFTTKGDGGTGLGLANVDDIVTRVGGHVLVDSEIGRGTRVRVVLPLAEPFEAEPGEKVATDSSPPTSETLPESRRSNA
jgi:signal transduction histidine kinase